MLDHNRIFLFVSIESVSYYYKYVTLYQERSINNISIAEVSSYSDYYVFSFTDAEINTNFIGDYSPPRYRICVAPIVYSNWTVNATVPAWTYCSIQGTLSCRTAFDFGKERCLNSWKVDINKAARLDYALVSSAKKAINNAQGKFSLFGGLDEIFYWGDESQLIKEWKTDLIIAIVVPNFVWMFFVATTIPYFVNRCIEKANYQAVN
eukprot:TRINITY_DN2386_c0_g1_i1.p1 TRINITY_DN2386_c0_g1~~TRINITY_DN2386_c0_g1_i1.p1  ORF type:complete len:207 (-),score=14.53 TRINITY_DN2386_c0_g1_i1:130-750(-)